MNKIISVIIVSFNKIDIIRDCLNSIRKYNDIGDGLEVIVSDNSTNDALYEAVNREYDWVKIIKNENIGFGAGNNRGFDIATGKYVLFLNPDTILVEPIFDFAVKEFEKDDNLALFGVQLIRPDGRKNMSYLSIDKYGICDAILSKFYRKTGVFKDGKMFICGADLFVRKESFEQAGRFDENIFMYKEEADLIKRIKLYSTAKRTAFYNNKKIIHLEGGTEDKGFEQQVKIYNRLLGVDEYYTRKWNLSVIKVFKQRRRYHRLKLFLSRCLFKFNQANMHKQIISLLNERILKAKDSDGTIKS